MRLNSVFLDLPLAWLHHPAAHWHYRSFGQDARGTGRHPARPRLPAVSKCSLTSSSQKHRAGQTRQRWAGGRNPLGIAWSAAVAKPSRSTPEFARRRSYCGSLDWRSGCDWSGGHSRAPFPLLRASKPLPSDGFEFSVATTGSESRCSAKWPGNGTEGAEMERGCGEAQPQHA